mgnify:CR=1 FL=1
MAALDGLRGFAVFIVLLFAGWWRYAEGNGYIVQRLAASKDEGHAQGASLWFAVALISLAAAAHQGWSANVYTLVSDTFPKQSCASVAGRGCRA